MKKLLLALIFTAHFGIIQGTAQQVQLDSGLIAYYPFNGNSIDESGNGYNGAVIGASLASDRYGNLNKAFYFDGMSNFINIGDRDTLDLSTTNFTISFWLNTTQHSSSSSIFQTSGVILYKGAWWSESGYCLYIRGVEYGSVGGHICAEIAGAQAGNGTIIEKPDTQIIPINDGQWHNIIFRVDRSDQAKIYIDGKLYISQTIASETGSFSNTIPLTIGGMVTNDRRFNGFLDEIRFYSRLLTSDEILALSLSTSINPLNDNQLKIYPVPALDVIKIDGLKNRAEVSVISSNGQIVKQLTISDGILPISELQKGVYLIKIKLSETFVCSKVFVKE